MISPAINTTPKNYYADNPLPQPTVNKAKASPSQKGQANNTPAGDKPAFPPSQERSFKGQIDDPQMYHWDSWMGRGSNAQINKTLFALSMRRDIPDKLENIHIRGFEVIPDKEHGVIFQEKGPVFTPAVGDKQAHHSNSVWTGSTLATEIDGKEQVLFAYTGIPEKGPDKPIFQTFGLARQNPESGQFEPISKEALLDPVRDRDSLVKHGYYMGTPGTEGGVDQIEKNMLCLRDPFLVEKNTEHGDKQLQVFFAAKKDSPDGDGGVPAVGRALLKDPGGKSSLEILPPVTMRGMDPTLTQYEVPQIVPMPSDQGYLMATSTCSRLTNSDTDADVKHTAFILHSQNLEGPYEVVAQALKTSDAKYPIALYGDPQVDDSGNVNVQYLASYDRTSPKDRTMGGFMNVSFRLPEKP